MVDAVLIFPPLANPFYPYLSIPTLSAYLQENGRTVEPRDLNLELMDESFTTENIRNMENDILAKINFLDSLPELDWKKQEEYLQLIRIKWAIENMRNSSDLTPEEVKAALRDLNSYRYEDNLPVLLEPWKYYQKFYAIYSTIISPVLVQVNDTKSVQRAINGEEYYFFYKLLKEKYVPDILKNKPRFVGISITYQPQVIPALYLGYLLKQADPSIFLCIGGPLFSTIGNDIHNFYNDIDFVDGIVVNEGEVAINQIFDYLDGKGNIEDVINLFHLKDGKVIENKGMFMRNINNPPLPDFSGLPLDKYFTGSLVLPYGASKGCYYNKCTFCSFPVINPIYRVKTPVDVALEIKQLSEKYNTKLFYFINEADPPKRIKQLSEEIIKLDLKIFYHSFSRFDRKVDREMLELLVKSGCRVLFFGLEAASNRINEMMMKKGVNLEKVKEVLKDCHDLNISTVVSSIIAFPTETFEEAMRTREFLETYSYYWNRTPISHEFRLPRGTDIEINHQNYGITKIYHNEGNLAATVANYETSYRVLTAEERNMAKVPREKTENWPINDSTDLLYSLYYDGNVPIIFSYNKKLEPPQNPRKKAPRPFKNDYTFKGNKHSFLELIKRQDFRLAFINILYKKGYFYEEIEGIISDSILGKTVKQYEFSLMKDFKQIQNFIKGYNFIKNEQEKMAGSAK